jgi:hypothetical protein
LGRSHANKKERSNTVAFAGLPDGQGFFLYFSRGGGEGKAVEIMENGIKLARGCQLVSWCHFLTFNFSFEMNLPSRLLRQQTYEGIFCFQEILS